MFHFVKIQSFFNTCLFLNQTSLYFTFIYNEDTNSIHNLHGKYWEINEAQMSQHLVSDFVSVAVSEFILKKT